MPDYDAMADDYEAAPPTADEVLAIEYVPHLGETPPAS